MPATEFVCSECSHTPDSTSPYCPECGSENPWEERNLYDMDEVDFPVVFPVRITRYEPLLWECFCEEVFGARIDRQDVANVPEGFPSLPELHLTTYWVMRKEDDPLGPFVTREDARAAIPD